MQQRAIKTKIKSTVSIKKITRTMEMISVTKMKKSMVMANNYKDFIDDALNILNIIKTNKDTINNIYADKVVDNKITSFDKSSKNLYIVIAGQKGLAGSYNVNILRALNKIQKDFVNNYKDLDFKEFADFISINKYSEKIVKKFLNKEKTNILMSFNNKTFIDREAKIVFDRLSEDFLNKVYKNVFIIYTDFISTSSFEVKVDRLLPFEENILNLTSNKDIKNINNQEFIFEPNINNVIVNSVKIILSSYILYAYQRSLTSEHISRMNAMHIATENAGELISDLKLLYNKSRQAAITQEISEISAGANS